MPLPPMLQAIVDFVRKGYPQGVPERDYLPLFALLRRRLSEDEVEQLATELARDPAAERSREAIGAAILGVTDQMPSESDIERIRARLAAAGWQPEA
ncbi:MAG: DUF3349 domain-containing protein [Actinocrinis sp.]